MKRNFWSKSRHSVSLVAGLLTRLLIVRNTPPSTINTRRNIGEMVVRCNVQTKQILQAENCEKVCTEKGSRSFVGGFRKVPSRQFWFLWLVFDMNNHKEHETYLRLWRVGAKLSWFRSNQEVVSSRPTMGLPLVRQFGPRSNVDCFLKIFFL